MSGDWSGNLIDFYLGVTQRIDRQLPRPFGLTDDGMRHESRSRVNDAIHEAIANALVHAYYGSESHVTIVMEPHRIRITNPGTFLMDHDVAIAGGNPVARNPILVRIFSIVGITDVAGSGLQSIYGTWRERFDGEPVLVESFRPDVVTLELPLDFSRGAIRPGGSGGRERESGGMSRGENGRDRTRGPYRHISNEDIVALCRERGPVDVGEVARSLDMASSTAQLALRRLAEKGVLQRERVGRKYLYRLVDPGSDRQGC